MSKQKWHKKTYHQYIEISNEDGATLAYSPNSGVKIIEKDGYAFKDLNKNGQLDPYEDWRLPIEERIDDLVQQMSIEEIAGLMLYSGHQAVTREETPFSKMFAGTYQGKSFEKSQASISDLTDQQKDFLKNDHLRHVLVTLIETPEIAATWSNHLQSFAEGIGLGIPVNISSDPRHGAEADAEFNAGSGGTISKWPEQLGLAATFEPELIRSFGQIASQEYRALGIATALSPQIDLATEPRWMRYSGTFGESAQLVADLAEAYCDGFQETQSSELGWGNQSVNAMVKHWPGGGSGEAGRDAHYAYGKYAVYPGENFNEHLKPFLEGAFKLKGKTKQASAVMPYYTISMNQDIVNHENVGNGFSQYLIQDLLREKYRYEGVVCTDWGITGDAPEIDTFISGKSWGVEHLSLAERHYKVLMAGVDQFGGNNDVKPVLEAYQIGVATHGEAWMTQRFRRSAARLLKNLFQVGLFEHPYLDEAQSKRIVGNPKFMETAYQTQQKSLILLKNKAQILPLKKKQKVYIPNRMVEASKDWFGHDIPAHEVTPASGKIVEKYYTLVDDPNEADFALVFMQSPKSMGYSREDHANGGNGYVPVTLQYRPYQAKLARKASLAGGDPLEATTNRSYLGKWNHSSNEKDLDVLLATREKMGDKPVIVSLSMKNPTIVAEFEPFVDGIVADFGVQTQAIFSLLSGEIEPSGLLPFQMPKNMEVVELQQEDVAFDVACYQDETGHLYDFAFGLNWSGQIVDERTKKYKK